MSGVDVLAVMDRAVENLQDAGVIGNTIGLKNARAAVAELIEKANEVAKHTETLCVGGLDIGLDLIDALARVTGGTP